MQTFTTAVLTIISSILAIELISRMKKRKWGENP
jgi:hypothetical protein